MRSTPRGPAGRQRPDEVIVRCRLHPTRFLWSLGLLTTSTSVVSSLGAPLVPTLASEFDVSLSAAQWALTASFLVGTVATPVVGRLGADVRRRPVVIAGLVAVLLGLLLCTLPLPFAALLAGRALQGTGLALAALALASARELLPPERVRSGLALLSVSTVVGAGVGYPITAAVAQHGGVRAAFGFGLLITVLTLAACLRYFPPALSRTSVPLDWTSVALLMGATLAALLAISQGYHWGWGSLGVLGLTVAAVGLGACWVWRSLVVAQPLVDLRLARTGDALVAHLAALMAGVAVYMLIGLVMVQVQAAEPGFGLARSVSAAGLMLTPYAISTVIGSQLATRAAQRVPGHRPLLPVGLVLYLSASIGLLLWHDSIWTVAAVMAVGGLGSGCTFASMPGLVVRGLPVAETSSALSFNLLLRYLGFAVGSALAITCLDVFSTVAPDAAGFSAAVIVCCGVWALALLLALGLGLRRGDQAGEISARSSSPPSSEPRPGR